eukprot:12883616-Prorocentrum_lima.AAC.1
MFVSTIALQRTDVTNQSFIGCPDFGCFLHELVGLFISQTCSTHAAMSPYQAWVSGYFDPS